MSYSMGTTLIETGLIKKVQDRPEERSTVYEMRFLGKMALEDILNLQELIASNLPSPEIFRLHDKGFFLELFKIEHAVIGIITEGTLIAYSLIHIPGRSQENLGKDADLPDEELNKVAHLQAVVVHPDYRGNGFQRRMGGVQLQVIEDMGYEHVCCTVSPKNPISLRNIISNGFVIKGLRPKFKGSWRYIMYKNIPHPILIQGATVGINSSDIEGQIDLLTKGFLGFDMKMGLNGFDIIYGRPEGAKS